MIKIKEYAKLMRLKAMGVSTIAIFGALSVNGTLEINHLIVLFAIGVFFNILGFVLNDYIDYDIDIHSNGTSERPLVKGTISRKTALLISFICYIFIFSLPLIFFRDIFSLLILFASVSLGSIYDCLGKRFLGSDFILAASIALFCLYGAATVSPHNFSMFSLILCSIIFMHVLFFNIIEGGFKDVDNDRKSGALTTAVRLGVKTDPKIFIPNRFVALAISIELTSACLVFLPFIILSESYNFEYWILQVFVLLILTVSLFLTLFKMLRLKTFDRKIVRRIITKQEITRYIVAAVLLMSLAGVLWSITLILLPIVWYFIFAFLLYDKSYRGSRML